MFTYYIQLNTVAEEEKSLNEYSKSKFSKIRVHRYASI